MLFPEKMIDFFRTTGPLLIWGESLALGKIFSQDGPKKKKNKNTIKIKFQLQTFNLHQIIQRELMKDFLLAETPAFPKYVIAILVHNRK